MTRQRRQARPAYPRYDGSFPWARPSVGVLVVGDRTAALQLSAHLPLDWAVQHCAIVPMATTTDLLVLYGATGRSVATARRRQVDTVVVAVVGADAPADVIADVLEAGADVCVRHTDTAAVVEQVRAYQHRRGGIRLRGLV